jgi:Carboxypeptidase regulatory-like domain/TonB dependent receptor
MGTRVTWLFFVLFIHGAIHPLSAQNDRATLEGTISDPAGAVVAGAKIKITEVATAQSQERNTNDHGFYRFPGIAIGEYTVEVTHDGFATKFIEDVELEVGETHTLDVALVLGDVSERVEVKAEDQPVERSTAESAAVIRDDQIDNLPTNGRNWATLTILAPWAQDDGGGDQRTIRFAGRARDDNNFQIDGVDSTGIQEQAQKSTTRLQISEDAIAEYRVDSALYDAEYGSQAGGQVDVVTKAGTNDFHGTVFGYLRNQVLDARNFNDVDINGNPSRPPFRLGQYGFTFGGPIQKDKSFFFLNYEGLRQLQALTYQAVVPDPGLQQAILRTSPVLCPILQAWPTRQSAVAQNTTLGCAPTHVFPDALFSNSNDVPFDPTNVDSSGFDFFTHQASTTIHEDTWMARIDHRFSESTTLYARAQRDVALTKAPLGNALDQQAIFNRPANYVVALEHMFSPNLLNVAKFGLNRSPFHNPQICNFPLAVNTDNFEALNDCNTDNEVGTTLSFVDDVTITHGRNTFKTGIELRRVRLNQGITADNTITFTDNLSIINDQVDNLFYRSTWWHHHLRHTFILPYFEDQWKVTPTLTLNLGLRWEYYGVANDALGQTTVFDLQDFGGICIGPNSTNPFRPFEPAGCPKNPSLYLPNYRNWDPRVGVAWAPSALHGKTVIRSGFGIYHGAAQNDDLNAGLESDNTRIQAVQGEDGIAPGALNYGPGFLDNPPNFGIAGGVQPLVAPRGLWRHRRDLYVEQWGLTVEHELPASILFTASYLGSHGVRLFARNYENLCDVAIHEDDATGNQCVRPLDSNPIVLPGPVDVFYGSVDFKRDDGNSHYNGLLLSLQRRFTNGFSLGANYTWSHSENDGSIGGGEANAPENAQCLRCEYGPSTFDIRDNIVVNSVYELPFGPGKAFLRSEGAIGKLVGGWQISGIGTWHTGHPLTVLANIPPNQLPDGNDGPNERPDVIPGVPLMVAPTAANNYQIVNPDAFAAPPVDPGSGILTRFGNEPNGLVRAPHIWQIDFELLKETKVTERLSVQFAAQAFNIFNHTQLADPSNLTLDFNCTQSAPFVCSTAGSGSFGQITSVNGFNSNNDNFFSDNVGTGFARQFQFMLRLKF